VTLQGIAESFSALGVPVFLADVKGDLSGISTAGSPTAKNADKLVACAKEIGIDNYSYADNPAIFWDLYGEQGHPIRTTVSEMGPLLLARLMGLNETQEGVLSIAFKYADEEGLLLLDLSDLQSMLAYCAENADALSTRYGNVTKASVGAIQRQLLQLESQGGAHFFGEPALDIHDFLKVDDQGRGYVNVLAADKLMQSPKLYATFLLWLLAEMFEKLPEVCEQQSAAFLRVAALVPRIALDQVKQEKLADGLTRIEMRVSNRGYLGSYGLASAKKLPHSEPLRLSIECEGVRLAAPSEPVVEIGHLDGWGKGLYNGPTIFAPWTRGNIHEKFVALVAEGRGRIKLRLGSCRVGYKTFEVEVG